MTIFWLDREEAVRRLEEAARDLASSRPDVASVHLFGSLAEGRAVPGSDADVLIVLEESDRRWMDRPLPFRDRFEDVGLPVELFCYTVDEVPSHPLAERAVQRGIRLA